MTKVQVNSVIIMIYLLYYQSGPVSLTSDQTDFCLQGYCSSQHEILTSKITVDI
jgi:hypothetical protein